jgi:hypothetical protein
MVTALDSVWKSLEQRRNKDTLLRWRDKSFPYYDDLYILYDGEFCCMDLYLQIGFSFTKTILYICRALC